MFDNKSTKTQMKKIILYTAVLLTATSLNAQINLKDAVNSVENDVNKAKGNSTNGDNPLSSEDVAKGLKEALSVGTNNSSASASKADGFYKNAQITIPFPPEANQMKKTLDGMGMQEQTTKFVETLNRGAEEAAKGAATIFLNAVTNMTIGDAFAILKGSDSAATVYLKNQTSAALMIAFKPTVQAALKKVDITKYWNPLVTSYNRVPFVKKQNPDLDTYVTQRAIAGLFLLIAIEEKKIRKDPAAQVTDILKKVFGGL